jgi:hypothetical protein
MIPSRVTCRCRCIVLRGGSLSAVADENKAEIKEMGEARHRQLINGCGVDMPPRRCCRCGWDLPTVDVQCSCTMLTFVAILERLQGEVPESGPRAEMITLGDIFQVFAQTR